MTDTLNSLDPVSRFRSFTRLNDLDQLDPAAATGEKVELRPEALEIAEQFSEKPISPIIISMTIKIVDFLAIPLLGLAIFLAYLSGAHDPTFKYFTPIALSGLLVVIMVQSIDGYDPTALKAPSRPISRAIAGWTVIFAAFTLLSFFMKMGETYSRVWLAGWFLSGMVYFAVSRILLSAKVRKWIDEARLERRAVIVGGGKIAEDLIYSIEHQPHNDVRICGLFDDRSDDRSPPVVAGYPKLGTISELVEFARLAHIDLLIVSLPLTAEGRVVQMLKKLWVLPVDIRLSAHTNKLKFRPRSYSYIGSTPFLDIFDKPLADGGRVSKFLFDKIIGALAILALSPIMLAVAVAVRCTSKGPVLFKQKRYGFNNEMIEIYKFRSMYTEQCDATANKLVTKDDPRVTPVGRFIRKTSLDELPQLFNVMSGTLSLVGPRPHAVSAKAAERLYNDVVDGYFARHKVRPGITGWAQINGWRGETDTREKLKKRVEHDLFYIENWSLWFDLYILFLTPFRLFKTENAY